MPGSELGLGLVRVGLANSNPSPNQPPPHAAGATAAPLCLSPSLITKKQQRLRAHGGATVKEVRVRGRVWAYGYG